MAKTLLYPADICMSPSFVMDRLSSLFKKHGIDVVMKENKFKAEREAWIAAAFFLGLMTAENKEYWIAINPEDTAPDIYGISFDPISEGIHRKTYPIEVFVWGPYSKNTLIDAIKAKLNKHYPKDFILLCYIYGHAGEGVNLRELHQQVAALHPEVVQIFLVGSQEHPKHDYKIMMLHGGMMSIDFTLSERQNLKRGQKDIIKSWRGRGTEFIPMGTMELPLP
jgi:hypothetical protein